MRRVDLPESDFPETWRVLREGLVDQVSPGWVAGLWRRQEPDLIQVAALGERRRIPSAQPMRPDTVFDLASLTKVFATATLASVLVERGWIGWETPLRDLMPDYLSDEIRLSHLLSHTAGLPAWQPFWEKLRARYSPRELWRIPIRERQTEMRRLVAAVPAEASVGVRAVYSDLSFLLLGFALEEGVGMPLDHAVKEFVWKPMGITGAYFRRVDRDVERGRQESVAATENCAWRGGVLQGQVHDDNCWAMGGYAGHAGAFGRAEDVLKFAAMLLSGFLSAPVLNKMWSRWDSTERTLGWDTPSGVNPAAGKLFSAQSVGHLGFTGTSLWIDPPAGLAVVLLGNRVHPSRDSTKIREFRPRFHNALRQDLMSHSIRRVDSPHQTGR